MKIVFHEKFKKQYKKLRPLRQKVDARLRLFVHEPFHVSLNNHALAGPYKGLRSINITGDYRAIYQLVYSDTAYFIGLDKYANLYG